MNPTTYPGRRLAPLGNDNVPRDPQARPPARIVDAQRDAFERALRQRQHDPADDERPAPAPDAGGSAALGRVARDATAAVASGGDEGGAVSATGLWARDGSAAPGDETGPHAAGRCPEEPSATAAKAAREAAGEPGAATVLTGLQALDGSAWQLRVGDGLGPGFELHARRADRLAPSAATPGWQLGLLATGLERQQLLRQAHRLGERLRERGLIDGELRVGGSPTDAGAGGTGPVPLRRHLPLAEE